MDRLSIKDEDEGPQYPPFKVEINDVLDYDNESINDGATSPLLSSRSRRVSIGDRVPEDEEDTTVVRRATLKGSIFNLCNAVLGAGVLSIPFAIKSCGLILGLSLIAFTSMLSVFSLILLTWCCELTKSTSYFQVAQRTFGRRCAIAVDMTQSLYGYGVCIGFMIILADTLLPLLEQLWSKSVWTSRGFVLSIVAVVAFLPLTMMKSTHALRHTSMVAIACIFYLVIILIVQCASKPSLPSGTEEDVELISFSSDTLLSIPIFCFAFNCQIQFIPILSELKKPRKSRVTYLIQNSMVVCTAIYIGAGVAGYLTFYNCTAGNILKFYPQDDVSIGIARLALAITIIMSYPLYSANLRKALDNLCFMGNSESRVRDLAWTVGLVGSTLLIAIFVTSLEKVFQITGSVGGVALVYLYPSAFYWKASQQSEEEMMYAPSGASVVWWRRAAVAMFGFGLVCFFGCTAIICVSIAQGDATPCTTE